MLALLLTFSLFLFLMFLGRAVMDALGLRFPILRSWLLAPCIGLSTVVLSTLNLNQTGLPIKVLGPWLTLAFIVFIVAVFYRKHPILPWRQLGVFIAIAFLSLLYSCWPMFLYGFRWVGYMNADMGTYCLGALRALNHGFYRIPEFRELSGTDYSQYWWFHHVPGIFRVGADIFLAWCASVTNLQPLQLSMPVLAATNLAQLFAGASLILSRPRHRGLAVAAGVLLAFSPLFLLGVIAQSLSQVGGVAILLGLCTLCMRPFTPRADWRSLLKNAFMIAWLGAALCVYYPEVLPFVALAVAGFQGCQLLRRKQAVYPLAITLAGSGILLLIVARQHIFTAVGAIRFALLASLRPGAVAETLTSFGTMLHPSLFAALFGFQTYYGRHSEPWLSITILAGMLLLTACTFVCIWQGFKGAPWAFLLFAMLAVGTHLFFRYSAYGIYKLAIFAQPVLMAPIAALGLRLAKRRRYPALLIYLAATCAPGCLYVAKSTNLVPGISIMLPRLTDFDVVVPRMAPGEVLLIDGLNASADAVFAAAGIGADIRFADFTGARAFVNLAIEERILLLPYRFGFTKDYLPIADSLGARVDSKHATVNVLGHSIRIVEGSRDGVTHFGHVVVDPYGSCNNDTRLSPSKSYLTIHRFKDVSNYLSLVTSDKGGPIPRSHAPSRWQREKDRYMPGGSVYTVGRDHLFEVINPTPGIRLRVALTKGLSGRGRSSLPGAATITGENTQPLGFTGSGAANVISEPIQLYRYGGRSYFALDFGIAGELFPDEKTGLMRLFNTHIPRDIRKVIGFARSIVILPAPEYSSLVRPRSVASWPGDLLGNPGLEFSGIYEDGWVSNHAYLVLGKARSGEKLVIRGTLPGLGALAKTGNSLEVRLNGERIYSAEQMSPGSFEINHVLTEDASQCRVSLDFRQMERLTRGDQRPVSAKLFRVSIVGAPHGKVTVR